MQLEEKIYSSKELAEWFNVTPKTFSNGRKKYLKELEYFADFEDLGGRGRNHKGILIKKVLNPVYSKKNIIAYQIIKDNFHNAWHKSGYDTAARVGSQIWRENEELQELISEDTAKRYVLKARTEFYGKVCQQSHGTMGTCKFAYVVSNRWDEAILLTDEQIEIINEIRRKIYDNEQIVFLYEALLHKEITEEEYKKATDEWDSKENRADRYHKFISEVANKLGIMPDKVTLIIKQIIF